MAQRTPYYRLSIIIATAIAAPLWSMPEDCVDIAKMNPAIKVKLAYSSTENFLNEDAYGNLEICYLHKEAATKLSKAQELLNGKKKGYRIVVYDGLRPHDVQYKMWYLVAGTDKQKYVADPNSGSIHNYGAAVDATLADSLGSPLDMGTPFDYFGDLAQPRFEQTFLAKGALTKKQIENRELLREIMRAAGFRGIATEWWHFDAFPKEEAKKRFQMVECIIDDNEKSIARENANGLSRDENGYCLLIRGESQKIYLLKNNEIELAYDVEIGMNGLGKMKEGDRKTPLGNYSIKWMVSRNGPPKQNPAGVGSFVKDGETYAVLNTELYFGELGGIRVKLLPDGTKAVSNDPHDRPLSGEEMKIASDEKLWTNAYGGKNIFVMALNYPNEKDRNENKTGSCIEIHASATLEGKGYKAYSGTYGCIALFSDYAKLIYAKVNPGTPVRIVR